MKVSPDLKLSFTMLRQDEKIPALLYILREVVPPKQQTVVFAATRHHVELLVTVLESEGVTTSAVYGSMDFSARKLNIGRFRARKADVLAEAHSLFTPTTIVYAPSLVCFILLHQ